MADKKCFIHLSSVLVVLVHLMLAVAALATLAQAQTPVGYWTFDDGAGTKVADSSGNGHTASLVNGVSWVSGEIGGAVSANAAKQQYVSIPAIDLSDTQAVTVTLWANRTYTTAGGPALFEATGDYTSSITGFGFFPDDATCHGIQVALRGDVGYTTNCYSQPSSGVWHHLAVVFDKSQTGGNEVQFYMDGVLQTVTWSLHASTNTNSFGSNPIYLFSRAGTTEFSSGSIDDLRIYNSALTAAQIQQIYDRATLVSMAVTPINALIPAGAQQQFTATGTYKDGSHRNLSSAATWTSSSPSVATISSGGLVTGVAAGSATIQATSGSINGSADLTASVADLPQATSIGYVQGNYSAPQTPQTTVSVTFDAAQAAGDLNVVVVGWNDSTAVVTSVADNSGNTYTLGVGPTVISGSLSQSTYYAKNIAAAPAGANSVTVTFATAAAYPDIRILEYSGADGNNPVDVTAASSGNSATSSSGSATTTNPTDLIFGANIVLTTTSGPGSGFTSRLLTSPDGDIAEDQAVMATSSYSATAPLLSSGPWIMQMVAFRTPSGSPALVSIAVTPSNPSIAAGTQQQFTASGTYSDGSHQNLTSSATWTSSAPPVATISSGGLATAVAAGGTTIQAASGSITGSTGLTVTATPNFTLSASPASLNVGQGNQVTSTIATTISGGFNSSISLSASGMPSSTTVSFNPSTIPAPGSGNSTMTITVGSSTLVGTYPITVTGNGGGTQQNVTVALTVTPTSTTISYVQGNYTTPQTPQTTVSVTFNAAQAAGDLNVVVVGWNDSTAVVTSVADNSGNTYTLGVGPTVISGSLSQSTYYAKNIAAAPAGANSVTVTFATAAAYPDIRILEYSGADGNNPVDVTAASSGNSATSSSGSATTTNPTDLIFGANIVLTTTSGPGSGFTSRLLTSPDGDIAEDQAVMATSSYSATAPLLSSGPWIMQMVAFRTPSGSPALVSIAVTPSNPSIAAGTQQQFTASGTYSDGSHQNLTSSATWTSSAPPVATISSGGLATAVAAGGTTIQAASGSITGSTGLTVPPPSLVSIALTPTNSSIVVGGQQQFTATGTYGDGSQQNLTSSVTWTSSAPSVATIGSGGLATGVGAGSTTIQAASGSVNGSTGLTVTTQVLHSILLGWTASTSQVAGYNAYRSTTSGGPYTKVNSGLIPITSYTDQTVQSGYTYYYVATSVDSQGNESGYSNEAVATEP